MSTAAIAHETSTRLRLRLPGGTDLAALRSALEALPGVTSLRLAPAARSVIVAYDGRAATRREVLACSRRQLATAPAQDRPRAAAASALPLETALIGGALVPLLPAPLRPAAAVVLVGARTVGALRAGGEPAGVVLDGIALASTALTGHPLTATASVLIGAAAERWRDALVDDTDRLLAQLTPPEAATYRVRRGPPKGGQQLLQASEMQPGDCLRLAVGDVVPADGIVTEGEGVLVDWLGADRGFPVRAGERIGSGERLARGALTLRVERRAAASRAARLRAHIRHSLRSRETAGPLTPDLQRLVALPISAGGLVLALTGDTARTASMLQADPQYGLQLAHPVARAAALYASARHGALMSGLDAIERLAAATTFAFEDVGVLAESTWHVDRVIANDAYIDAAVAKRWLLQLMGASRDIDAADGFPDERVAAWREHGAVLPLRDEAGKDRVLHIGGAQLLARTWGIELTEPDRRSLVRRLGIVQDGRLLATVHLGCQLRRGVRHQFEALRALGAKRIAVFTEDPAAIPAAVLTQLGADAVLSSDRAGQERWLDEAVDRGERVALVHTGLRDILPPGGLSLCPVDAEAGAHGVLIGEPLAALLSARAEADRLRRALRWQFGGSVTANSVLMVLAAMQAASPLAISALRHGFALLLLQQNARLARASAPPAADPSRSPSRPRRPVESRTPGSEP